MAGFMPSLEIREVAGRVHLLIDEFGCYGDGQTLEEAADDLIWRLLVVAMAFKSGSVGSICSEVRPHPAVMQFIYELGEIAAAGDDIRARVFRDPGCDQFIPNSGLQ